MAKKTASNNVQILLFPSGEPIPVLDIQSTNVQSSGAPATIGPPQSRHKAQMFCDVVLSGSFRKDVDGLRQIHQELQDQGCFVLSPQRVQPAVEIDGFMFMKGEESEVPSRIELRHLEAIEKATFVWLHAPEGYVGLSASLEVGFAYAQGIPVFSRETVSDPTLRSFIRRVESPSAALGFIGSGQMPLPAANVPALQRYYKHIAVQRGYERETAQNCLLLMMEEVGELAHAIRKHEKLVRHGPTHQTNIGHELADVSCMSFTWPIFLVWTSGRQCEQKKS